MSRINTNVTALIGARVLNSNTATLNKSLERLSTGLRINRGADDPAGLIASENLRKQIRGTEAGIKNAERAVNIVSTAEGALNEVSALLLDVQGLLTEVANTGGMSSEEIDANQLQVDSILNSINRIANTTEFQGMKLLNGNYAYTTSAVSGTYIDDFNINSAKLIDGATMTVNVTRTGAADTGKLYMSGVGTSGLSPLTLQIGSGRGTTEVNFAGSTSMANIAAAINQVREVTGVSASLSSSNTFVTLRSVDFGTDAYVSVQVTSGEQATDARVMSGLAGASQTDVRDYGANATATVNGAAATADGKKLTIRTAMLDAELDLDVTAALSTANWTTTFGITGGGADFAIGASVDAIGLESLGMQNIATTSLGDATNGYLSTIYTFTIH